MESSQPRHNPETFMRSLSNIYQRRKDKNMPTDRVPGPNPVELVPAPKEASVDIVFIPGLGEQQVEPWTADDENRTLWPSMFLPDDVKHARILAFRYDSKDVTKHADEFGTKLHRLRVDSNTTDRPIILVAHSLGGIVPAQASREPMPNNLKRVLVRGREGREGSSLKAISQKIQGMVFFGTPFQGSQTLNFSAIIVKLVELYKLKDTNIAKESEVLCNLFPKALGQHLQENRQAGVMAFFESCPGKKLVDATAALIPSPNPSSEEATNGTLGNTAGLYSVNRNLGKFDDRGDVYYQKVAVTLQEMAKIKGTQDKGNGQGRIFNVTGDVGNLIGGNLNGDVMSAHGAPLTKGNVGSINFHNGNSPQGKSN